MPVLLLLLLLILLLVLLMVLLLLLLLIFENKVLKPVALLFLFCAIKASFCAATCNQTNMPIAQLWGKKDALALERRLKNKRRQKDSTDGGVTMERLGQAGSGTGSGTGGVVGLE